MMLLSTPAAAISFHRFASGEVDVRPVPFDPAGSDVELDEPPTCSLPMPRTTSPSPPPMSRSLSSCRFFAPSCAHRLLDQFPLHHARALLAQLLHSTRVAHVVSPHA